MTETKLPFTKIVTAVSPVVLRTRSTTRSSISRSFRSPLYLFLYATLPVFPPPLLSRSLFRPLPPPSRRVPTIPPFFIEPPTTLQTWHHLHIWTSRIR